MGDEHPHGFVKLETPGKIWLLVLAPPSRMENCGDEGRYLHEAAEESDLHESHDPTVSFALTAAPSDGGLNPRSVVATFDDGDSWQYA